jgi:hypothetical protein
MRDWLVLIAHLIVTTIRTIAPGSACAVIAESLLLKHQLLVLNRSRKKAPRLGALDRVLLGLGATLVSPQRILKVTTAFDEIELADEIQRPAGMASGSIVLRLGFACLVKPSPDMCEASGVHKSKCFGDGLVHFVAIGEQDPTVAFQQAFRD